jgi:bacteriocin-like protein
MSNDTFSLDHRTLTDTELNAVTGGLVVLDDKSVAMAILQGGGGGSPTPTSAWNKCLVSSGFPPMA